MKRLYLTLGPALALVPGLLTAATPPPTAATASDAALAIYMPPDRLSERHYSTRANIWIEPGRALDDSLDEIGKALFPQAVRYDAAAPRPFGLLLDMDPKWEVKDGRMRLTIQYNVFDPNGQKLRDGSHEFSIKIKGLNLTSAAYSAARAGIQATMMETLQTLHPSAASYPATGSTAALDPALLVDHAKPVRTGTGFYINGGGQLLTANHVQRDCVLLEASKGDQTFPVTRRAASELLDIAVLDSGQATTAALPLRRGETLELGESVTSVGYPLQGLLADSPNLTRGNVSSASGMKGSYGMFQFSAPIQPGNSGGPIVSDQGELLGVAVGTLNAKSLVDRGLLPQNVNFALDASYVARFLRRENIGFDEVQPATAGDMKTANDAALGATVQLACFE